jgi:chorismate synthase
VVVVSSIFGKIFQISTWGESHGRGVGVVVDGCPAGLEISAEDIQRDLNKRRPGQNHLVTPRDEKDKVEILSGVFEGKTTGTPIAMAVFNEDQRSHDYGDMVNLYRPSHADLSYDLKYGFRDYRGGGRSSARETIARVAAGAIARKLLRQVAGTEFLSWVESVHDIQAANIDASSVSEEMVEATPVRCPDLSKAAEMEKRIEEIKKAQDSVGGVLALRITKPSVGLGEPVFDRVEANLARAMLSIPATKGFEVGSGFAGTQLKGSEHNDPIYHDAKGYHTRTNHAGGVLGGVSNGEDIFCRIAFKPTATISQEQETASRTGESATLKAKGRHDPCVITRAPIIVEAMAALTLVDLYLEQRAKAGLL